jgi:hypothetical protein
MATQRKEAAARSNVEAARHASHKAAPKRVNSLRAQERNKLSAERFAFPAERKEPLTDASHVRNAIARFDQVEGVSNADRDRAWRRIRAAARRHGVEIEVRGWRQLMAGSRS